MRLADRCALGIRDREKHIKGVFLSHSLIVTLYKALVCFGDGKEGVNMNWCISLIDNRPNRREAYSKTQGLWQKSV